ncbi:MAG TPA: hypothetical protein VHU80_24995 [Polyangiaceae bacterium]|nr:hypothetical protein [Polyangiaceae bacterium]
MAISNASKSLSDAKMFKGVGPNGNYTLFRPDASLGKNGCRHPIATNYEKSKVQTFYATLEDSMAGHLYAVDVGASICIGSIVGFGSCGGDVQEHAPTIAFLRYFACGDQGAKKYLYGSDCALCKSPWTTPQRKPMDQWN